MDHGAEKLLWHFRRSIHQRQTIHHCVQQHCIMLAPAPHRCQQEAYSSLRPVRAEKLRGMPPVSRLNDRSLHRRRGQSHPNAWACLANMFGLPSHSWGHKAVLYCIILACTVSYWCLAGLPTTWDSIELQVAAAEAMASGSHRTLLHCTCSEAQGHASGNSSRTSVTAWWVVPFPAASSLPAEKEGEGEGGLESGGEGGGGGMWLTALC